MHEHAPALQHSNVRAFWLKWLLIAVVIGYVALLILAPLGALIAGALGSGPAAALAALADTEVFAAFGRTLLIGLIVVGVHGSCGTAVAWVLVRQRFRGRRILNGLIDLPFAVSPVVAGYMLILLFGRRGALAPLIEPLGIQVAFALPGMLAATLFVTLPFMVRELMPVLHAFGAVLRDRRPAAAAGVALPWASIAEQVGVREHRFYRTAQAEPLALVARADVPGLVGAQVLVARLLDAEYSRTLGADLGVEVRLSAALSSGLPSVARHSELARYQAQLPITDAQGQVVGTIIVSIPTTPLDQSLRMLRRTLLRIALIVVLLAGMLSFLFGRWLSRPLQALTSATARIGRGDLATPIMVVPGGEIGALASTLEEMRWRLLRLTADLRRQQAESQAILTGIVEGVFSVDRQRRIRFANPQVAAMLGRSPAELVGAFCGDVLNPQGPSGTRPCVEQCPIIHARFRNGAHATEHLLLPNGSRRTVLITSAPPSDDQQVQVLRDETEHEAIRRLRDTVLANISHEFRTPLSAQLASIELLLDQLPALNTDQIGQLIMSLQRGTLRLTQLIDNLLESARIESGRFAIRRRPIALDEVAEDALELMRPLLSQREQQASVELPFPLPLILGDAPLLTQVLVNLLANANKYAPAGSTITIGGAVQAGRVLIWVEDQGPGLPASNGSALFGQFIRSAGSEPEQSGVGLGLWIVQAVIAQHHGEVRAERTAAGCRIVLTLPTAELTQEATP